MTSLPLPLAHILEEEDVRLYGNEPGNDAPRERRWFVRESEVPNARSLAQKLSERLTNAPEFISRWREANGYDPEYRKQVVREINVMLESIAPRQWLFEDDAFADADQMPFSDLQDAYLFDPDEVFNLNRQMFDGLFDADVRSAADLRFKEVVARIHARAKNGTPRTALSISGGGIRSATYALGVLQGLARRHVLEKFDFLSTISGGGYIGGWLSSWVRRDPYGIRGVCSQLSTEPNDPLVPEPEPIRHLRAYSSYLIPRLSGFSADTWALAATWFRNVLLNWMVLIPLLAGLLAVPRLLFTAVVHNHRGEVSMDLTSKGASIAFFIGIALLSFGFGVLIRYRPVTNSKETKSLTDGKFVLWCLIPLVLSAVSLLLGWAWHVDSGKNEISLLSFLGAGLLATTAGFIVFLWRFLRSPFAEKPMDGKEREKRQSLRILSELGAAVAAGLTGGILSWVAATQIFPVPVEAVTRVGVVRWPILDPGGLTDITASYVCFGVPLLLAILFLQAAIFVGASSHANHDFDREWWSRASGWVLLAALGWIALSTIAIYGPVAIYHVPRILSAVSGAAGIFSVLVGKSGNTKGTPDASESTTSTTLKNIALGLAVPIFVLYILAAISLGTTKLVGWAMNFEPVTSAQIGLETRQATSSSRVYDALIASKPAKITEVPLANSERLRSYEHLEIVQTANPYLMLALALGCPLIALIISRCIGVNVFSMHAMYRNRLVRAYLGASRWSRDPNEFTGFDPFDNLPMHDLRPEYVWHHSFRDLDNAIGLLANARDPRLQLISTELRHELGEELDRLFDPETARSTSRPAFYQSLNVLIATRDLAFLHDPKNVPPILDEASRSLRNRRFVELAFGERQVFPSPMPLICAQDKLAPADFEKTFAAGASAEADALRKLFKFAGAPLLDEINEIISRGSLKDHPAFAKTNDPTPFRFSDVDPIHVMIDNRLRLEAAFPRTFERLRLPRPLHVIGMCLNLTGGEELAWQERKGESLSVTPVASGNYHLGYRDTRTYGDISLGTAVTISGAAASPNQGYNTSAPLAFLMTLFNVRLGWWLGNPGIAGNRTYERRNPKVSIAPLVRELTGNANDEYGYVYLSDGGHFENLGLYEMVLRRVHHIVVSDGGADPKYTYEDLGNAIRKIRIDLGIEIEIKEIEIVPPTEKRPGKYCAWGTIHYGRVDGPGAVEGELLYIKPVVYKNEGPRDVLNYQSVSDTFPHESTADQFFSESQFESYRRLGLFAVDQISDPNSHEPLSVEAFIEAAKTYLKPEKPTV